MGAVASTIRLIPRFYILDPALNDCTKDFDEVELVAVSIQVHMMMTKESQRYAENLQTNNYIVPKRREEENDEV